MATSRRKLFTLMPGYSPDKQLYINCPPPDGYRKWQRNQDTRQYLSLLTTCNLKSRESIILHQVSLASKLREKQQFSA